MSQLRAMRSAFSAVFRQPSIYLAEFVWRSVFAITATLLAFYALIGYLDSRKVTDGDLFGLFGFVPGTARAALTHIFQGSGPVLVRTVIALSLGAGLLWLGLATFGRSVTLSALLQAERPAFRVVAGWNMARLGVIYLVIAALAGASFYAFVRARAEDGSHDRGAFYALALPLWLVVLWIGMAVNGLIAVESLRRVRGDAREWRSGRRQFLWVAFVIGAMRVALWLGALVASVCVAYLALQSPPFIAWPLVVMSLLVYIAFSTLVHVLKLAGYVRILAWEAEPPGALTAVV